MVESPLPPLIELLEASFAYNRKNYILSDISLVIRPRDRIAIIGANGEGKSTLLKGLMGYLKLRSGTINKTYHFKEMAYVPQQSPQSYLMPMRVRDYVALGIDENISMANNQLNELIAMSLKKVDLAEKSETDISILSGGQFKRVVLARALIRHPKILYLDEPMAGLDRISEAKFMDELKDTHSNDHLCYVMVLHDCRYLQTHFNKVFWIENNHIKCFQVNEALNSEAFLSFSGLKL